VIAASIDERDGAMTTLNDAIVDELRLRLLGGVYVPGEPQCTDTCTLFNSMIDREPRLVAACVASDDVIAASVSPARRTSGSRCGPAATRSPATACVIAGW
jgi:hypothetical protein